MAVTWFSQARPSSRSEVDDVSRGSFRRSPCLGRRTVCISPRTWPAHGTTCMPHNQELARRSVGATVHGPRGKVPRPGAEALGCTAHQIGAELRGSVLVSRSNTDHRVKPDLPPPLSSPNLIPPSRLHQRPNRHRHARRACPHLRQPQLKPRPTSTSPRRSAPQLQWLFPRYERGAPGGGRRIGPRYPHDSSFPTTRRATSVLYPRIYSGTCSPTPSLVSLLDDPARSAHAPGVFGLC